MKLFISSLLVLYISTAAVIDIKNKKIPLLFFFIFGIIFIFLRILFISEGFNAFAFIPGLLLLLLNFFSSGSIGMGDCILILSLGVFLNPYEIIYVIFFSFFMASITGIFIFIKKRNRYERIPFIPFMLISFLLLLFV